MKKILAVLLLLLIPTIVYSADQDTVTQRDLRGYVRNYLGGNATSSFWTDDIVDDFVNLACREYAMLGGIQKIDTITTTNAVRQYALNSDFLRVLGVTRYIPSTKREQTLKFRAMRSVDNLHKAYGQDDDQDYSFYYSIVGGGDSHSGSYLMLDPTEEETTTDSIFVYYNAQATWLGNVAADTITNIPYSAIPLVVLSATRSCMIMNREDQSIGVVLPIVNSMYQAYFELLVKQQSDLDYNPETN